MSINKKSTSKLTLAVLVLIIFGIGLLLIFFFFYSDFAGALAPEGEATHSMLCRVNSMLRSYTPLTGVGMHFLVPQFLCDPVEVNINAEDCDCGIFNAKNPDPDSVDCVYGACLADNPGNPEKCDSLKNSCNYTSQLCAFESCVEDCGGSSISCWEECKNPEKKFSDKCSAKWKATYVNYKLGTLSASCWYMGLNGKRNPGNIDCYNGYVENYPDLSILTGSGDCTGIGNPPKPFYCALDTIFIEDAMSFVSAENILNKDDVSSNDTTYGRYVPTGLTITDAIAHNVFNDRLLFRIKYNDHILTGVVGGTDAVSIYIKN